MKSSKESKRERRSSKIAILDLLASRLNCERSEVNFLFGQDTDSLSIEAVEIPDVKFH